MTPTIGTPGDDVDSGSVSDRIHGVSPQTSQVSPPSAPSGETGAGCAKCAAVIAALQELEEWPDLPDVRFGTKLNVAGGTEDWTLRPEQVTGIYEALSRHIATLLPFGVEAVKALHEVAALRERAEAKERAAIAELTGRAEARERDREDAFRAGYAVASDYGCDQSADEAWDAYLAARAPSTPSASTTTQQEDLG